MSNTSTDGLTVSDVTISFGGVKALDSATLHVARGTWTGLIGPNGSGKTTMINVVSGVYKPDDGHVGLDGKNLSRVRAQRRAKAGIVRTFQHPQLAATLTLRENVELGIDLARRGGRSDNTEPSAAQVTEALELFGCDAYADYLPAQAPYGARKAAEVARAFAAQPVALLLDEPAAGLSREERQELVTALRTAQSVRPDMSVCLIEHDVQLVAAVCTQLQVLNFGKVIARGEVQQVLRNEDVRTAYLGRQHRGTDEEK